MLFPEIQPYKTGLLELDEKNKMYWEISGNPNGIPVVFVHGGPGGSTTPAFRRLFDPEKYKIILFDQRGCGKSIPSVFTNPEEIESNNTQNLIEDMEKLRQHLDIDKWLVFGGSWGSTLSLLYAEHYPERVKALILRGIFTARPHEAAWLFEDGAKYFAPKEWAEYTKDLELDPLNPSIINAYNKVLFGKDEQKAVKAALNWAKFETLLCNLYPRTAPLDEENPEYIKAAVEIARIENHFFKHYSWLKNNEILDNTDKIAHIPTTIVQGRYDLVCPPISAYELHERLPNSKLILTVAGHSAMGDEENLKALVTALNEYED